MPSALRLTYDEVVAAGRQRKEASLKEADVPPAVPRLTTTQEAFLKEVLDAKIAEDRALDQLLARQLVAQASAAGDKSNRINSGVRRDESSFSGATLASKKPYESEAVRQRSLPYKASGQRPPVDKAAVEETEPPSTLLGIIAVEKWKCSLTLPAIAIAIRPLGLMRRSVHRLYPLISSSPPSFIVDDINGGVNATLHLASGSSVHGLDTIECILALLVAVFRVMACTQLLGLGLNQRPPIYLSLLVFCCSYLIF